MPCFIELGRKLFGGLAPIAKINQFFYIANTYKSQFVVIFDDILNASQVRWRQESLCKGEVKRGSTYYLQAGIVRCGSWGRQL